MKSRIVILSAFLTPFRSGAEACAEEVSRRLTDQFSVTIVTARLRLSLPRHDTLNSVSVIRVGLGFGFDKWLYPFLAPFAVRTLKPDLTHAVLETFAGLALVFCPGKKLLTLQTTNRSFLKKKIMKSADLVTAISSVLVQQAKEVDIEAEKIPNGIDLAALETSQKKHAKVHGRILFVGRLESMKGVDTLLKAFANVHGKDLHLHIVGDGSQCSSFEHLTKKLGLWDHVRFTGRLSGDAIHAAYAQAEIFCALSRSEALGNVFLEAQAAGCAVVATNVGGIPDVVHDGKTGLLVSPNDPDAAAQALQKLIDDPALRKRLSEAGRKNAEAYDWDLIAPKYAAVYADLLSK